MGDTTDDWDAITAHVDIAIHLSVRLFETDGLEDWLDLANSEDLQCVGDIAIHLNQHNIAAKLDALYTKLPPNLFTVDVLRATGRSLRQL